jgi:SOS-response transcriptional repressor LexA
MWLGQQMILFYRMMASDERLRPQHVCLYFAILSMASEDGGTGAVAVTRRELMENSRLTSKATYHRCIQQLQRFGYIQYYPSYNPSLGSRVVLSCIG